MIRVVIFDLGNVLIHYDLRKAARRFSKACGVPMIRMWLHFLTSPSEKDYARGKISSKEFYRQARQALGFKTSYPDFRRHWNDIFWENEGMEALLRRRKKRYPLYLISNTNRMHYEYLKKRYPLLRHFKIKFASHEVGHAKPDPEIYRKALEKIGCRPGEAVFIDDNPGFVRGARRAGMHALRFKSLERLTGALQRLGVCF
ncbi:MAG: HAD family phosphatase [Candidatus Omnitrophota bacterium]